MAWYQNIDMGDPKFVSVTGMRACLTLVISNKNCLRNSSWVLYDMDYIHMRNIRYALRWRHNDHAGVSNHQPHGCLLNRLFRRKSKKTSKLRVTGHCAGNSPGTGEFPAQMASYAENVSIWWRHHGWKNSVTFEMDVWTNESSRGLILKCVLGVISYNAPVARKQMDHTVCRCALSMNVKLNIHRIMKQNLLR